MPERIFTFITICVTNIPPHSVFPVGTVTESRSLSEKAIMTFHSNLQNTFFACKSKFGTNCQKNEWKFGILLNNGREAKKKKKRGEIWEFCRLDSAEKTTCTRKLFIWLSHGAVKIYKINLSVQLFNEGIQAKEEANNLTEERDMWTEVRVAVHTRVEPA